MVYKELIGQHIGMLLATSISRHEDFKPSSSSLKKIDSSKK